MTKPRSAPTKPKLRIHSKLEVAAFAMFLLVLSPGRIRGQSAAISSTESKGTTVQQLPTRTSREAQIATDTERLYLLCKELQAELQKEPLNTLSMVTLKRAEEVEKLAHRLNEEMKHK